MSVKDLDMLAMSGKPRPLVNSSVLPFPRNNGQQQRVYYTLKALRETFHHTLLMMAPKIDITQTASELLDVCDEAIVLPSLHMSNRILRISHKIARMVYAFVTGYEISQLYNRNSGYFGRVIIRSYKIRLLML